MREQIIYGLAMAALLGDICLALHWLWQAWLRLIGVSYEETEEERNRASDNAQKHKSGIPHETEG